MCAFAILWQAYRHGKARHGILYHTTAVNHTNRVANIADTDPVDTDMPLVSIALYVGYRLNGGVGVGHGMRLPNRAAKLTGVNTITPLLGWQF